MTATPAAKKIVYACPVDHHNSIIFITSWFHGREAHTSLLLVPDFAAPIELYATFASQLVQAGIHVYLYNQREKSLSVRKRDLLQVAAWIRHREEGVPPVLVSKGLGALLCSYFSVQYPKFCRGVLSIDPVSSVHFSFPGQREFLLFFAEMFPNISVPAWLNCLRTQGQSSPPPILFHTLFDFLPRLLGPTRGQSLLQGKEIRPQRVLISNAAPTSLEFFREGVLSWVIDTFSPTTKPE